MPSQPRTPNASDRRELEKARKEDTVESIQEQSDLKTVVSTPEGRRFIWRVLGECKVYESIFSPSAHIYHNSGKQDIGHWLQSEFVRDFPDLYFLMIKENGNAQK